MSHSDELDLLNGPSNVLPLSNGALKTIMDGNRMDNPVMQVLSSSRILLPRNFKRGMMRYRLLLSDGQHFSSFASLSIETARLRRIIGGNYMEGLPQYCIIKLKRYNKTSVDYLQNGVNRPVLNISDFELVTGNFKISRTLGNPVPSPVYKFRNNARLPIFDSVSKQPVDKSAGGQLVSTQPENGGKATSDNQNRPDYAMQSLISQMQFNFQSIDGLAKMKADEKVDIIGICTRHTELEAFTSQKGRSLKKRELILVDESRSSISLTIWGADAETYNQSLPVVLVRGALVQEFLDSKSLTLPKTGFIFYNPNLKESRDLRNWYAAGGDKEEPLNITTRRCERICCKLVSFKEVEDLGLRAAEPGLHFLTKGTVLQTRTENSYYKGCPLSTCHKKVIHIEERQYRCEKCKETYLTFKYEIATTILVSDWSACDLLTVFSRDAKVLFGKTATEIAMIGEIYGESSEEYKSIMNTPTYEEFMFRYRGKINVYNNKQQVEKQSVEIRNTQECNASLTSNIVQLIG